jgi:hypothetical protein
MSDNVAISGHRFSARTSDARWEDRVISHFQSRIRASIFCSFNDKALIAIRVALARTTK